MAPDVSNPVGLYVPLLEINLLHSFLFLSFQSQNCAKCGLLFSSAASSCAFVNVFFVSPRTTNPSNIGIGRRNSSHSTSSEFFPSVRCPYDFPFRIGFFNKIRHHHRSIAGILAGAYKKRPRFHIITTNKVS